MRAFLDGMEEQVRTHSEAHAANGVSLVALGTESGKRRAKKGAVTASDFVSSRPPPRRPLSLAAAPDPTPRSTNSPTLSRFSFGTNYEESRGMDWSSGSEASRANPPELATSYPLSATPVPIPMRRQPVADRRHSYPTLSAPSTSNDARRRYSVFHHGCPPAPSAIVQRQWASTSESIPEERQPEFAPRYRYSLTPSSSTESFVSFFGTDRGVGGLSPTSSGLSPAYGGYDACGSEPFSPLYSKSRRDSFQVYLPPPYPPPQYQGQRDDRSQLDPSPPQSQFQHLWTPDPAYAMPLQQQPQSAQEQEHERGRPLSLDMGRAGGEAANSWQWSPDAVDGGGAGAGAAYDYGTSSYRLPTYRPSSASSLSVMDRRGSLIGAVLEPFPPDDLASPEPAWRDARVDDAGAAGSQEESQSRGVRFEEPAVAERRAWSVDHGRPFVYGEDAYSRRCALRSFSSEEAILTCSCVGRRCTSERRQARVGGLRISPREPKSQRRGPFFSLLAPSVSLCSPWEGKLVHVMVIGRGPRCSATPVDLRRLAHERARGLGAHKSLTR